MELERILRQLTASEVEFVIVGGVAGATYGLTRPAPKLELCYHSTRENLEQLIDALSPLNPRLRGAPDDLPFQWNAQTLQRGLNFTLFTDAGAVDLLGEVTGLGAYQEVLAHAEVTELYGCLCVY